MAQTPSASGRIFISYRREDTAYPAGWLFDRLRAEFSPGQIFKDVDSIALGDDFVEVITNAVASTDVLLALIGHQWLTITSEDGGRRLDDPDDFVRLEVEAALARNVRVIPILVEGAKMPRPDELPPSLAPLTRRQALELSPNRFDFDTSRLLRVLDRTFAELQAEEQAEPEPRERDPPTRVGGSERRRPSALRRRNVVAAAAVVALIVLAIVLAVTLGSSSSSTSEPTGGTTTSGGGKNGGGSPKPLKLAWSPAYRFGGAGHQEVTALGPTAAGSGIAVGFQTVSDPATGNATNHPLAWRYRHGGWRPDQLTSSQRYGELQGVAFDRSTSTIAAVGAAGLSHGHTAAAVWTKAGNGVWQQVCLGDCSSPVGRAEIWGVLALPAGGFVAWGQGAATSPTVFHPTIWTSDNGVAWDPRVLDERAVGAVQSIARTAKGQLVAVGKTGPEHGTSAAVWTSGDGSHWRAVHSRALAGARELHAVTAKGNTLLAVGFTKRTRATPDCGRRRQSALFRSTDGGRTWQVRRTAALANAEQWLDVVAYGKQFVALGYDFAGCTLDSVALASTSPSGNAWTEVRGQPFRVRLSLFGRGGVIGRALFAGGDGPSRADTSSAAHDERDAEIWSARATK
jgi:hypothetical protein